MKIHDTFQNRIILIFLHTSFLFVKIKQENISDLYKDFSQKFFDYVFKIIEVNLREIGWSDTRINKDMKLLVKEFYNILLECEKYRSKNNKSKIEFLMKHITIDDKKKTINTDILTNYFDKYQSFCLDLSEYSVLKGDINFSFNNNN